jgi:hypothetical protein
MDKHFRKGQRVISEHFGEGTVTGETMGDQVEVGFSELETFTLPARDLQSIGRHSSDSSVYNEHLVGQDSLLNAHFAPGENSYLNDNPYETQ